MNEMTSESLNLEERNDSLSDIPTVNSRNSDDNLLLNLKNVKSKARIESDDSDSDDDIPLSAKLKNYKSPVENNGKDVTNVAKTEAKPAKAKSPVDRPKSKSPTEKKRKLELESESEDDIPLAKLQSKSVLRKNSAFNSDDEDVPLSKLKSKTVTFSKVAEESDSDSDENFAIKKKKLQNGKKPKDKAAVKKEKPSVKKVVKAKEEVEKKPSIVKVKKEEPNKNKYVIKEGAQKNGEKNSDEEEEEEAYKWWEDENPKWDDTVKWQTLEHNGVVFPPPYKPHNIPIKYKGQEIKLSPEAEEVASFYAAMIETDFAKNETFNENFFKEFRALLTDAQRKLIVDLKLVDFSAIALHFERLKEEKKKLTKEDKLKIKQEKLAIDEQYGIAIMDGRKEKIGNFRVEPPGLFRGRGNTLSKWFNIQGKHPKTGCLKRRIYPEDVTINIGPNNKVPTPPAGHSWKEIIHNNTVTWLATWTDTVNNTPKYVFLAATSSLKGQSDFKKFEKARELKGCVEKIRERNQVELKSEEMSTRQRATALWLIDHLALRAGNEKGDDEADTVGCCSLRVEHVQIEIDEKNDRFLIFDFLGKDSIRYYNRVKVPEVIYNNIRIFQKKKNPDELLFDKLNTALMNKYLNSLLEGLTAKVFRTFNASFTFQNELKKTPEEGTTQDKILAYNRSNRQVAVLCNHQRSIPKGHGTSMEKLKEKILMVKYDHYLIRQKIIKNYPEEAKHYKETESDLDEDTIERKRLEKIEMEKQKELKKLEKEKEEKAEKENGAEEKPEASKKAKKEENNEEDDDDDSKAKKRKTNDDKVQPFETLAKKLETLKGRIASYKTNLIDRDENKTTALGTSKLNYIDPRISMAWCKKYDVAVEKIFNKTLREKFKWAMTVDDKWEF